MKKSFSDFPLVDEQKLVKSVIPITTTAPILGPALSDTKPKQEEKRSSKKVSIKFTAEQLDMNKRDFVITNHYKSEEVTEPPTTTPGIDHTIEFVPPYVSNPPSVYYYYY